MTASLDTRSLVYGPVPSRRLGRSLGVDLVPFKTCTYDCVYCQLGPTTCKTAKRDRWVEPAQVLEQVRGRLSSRPDVIALAGSGEPTLYAGLGEVVAGIKAMVDVPLVVITNGSLLGRPDVQRDLAGADIVLPSLDAVDDASYRAVNRPHEDLDFDGLVDGMADFRASFSGEVWLEVMLLEGVTGTGPMVEKLAGHAARIAPDRIQLNTVVRPPAEQDARPVSPASLAGFAAAFTPRAEVIAGAPELNPDQEATAADVLTLISRRPCTMADVATGLGIHQNTALKALTALVERDEAQRRDHGGGVFYAAADHDPSDVEES
jgi:wyosine [tRNA(Phe)-imidazoG37] synthetase (radical SAM superfamily)